MGAWLAEHKGLLVLAVSLSTFLFFASLILLPIVIVRLPKDYFVRERREPIRRHTMHPVLWVLMVVLKNMVGVLLMLAGIAMLFMPGQGLLSIFMGVALCNFPGKYRLLRKLLSYRVVRRALNGIRRKFKHDPLEFVMQEVGHEK